jgi:hypothetical protein
VLVPVTGDKQIPLSELSTIRTLTGPSMIRNEDSVVSQRYVNRINWLSETG